MVIFMIISLAGLVFGYTASNMKRDDSENDPRLMSREIGWTILLLTALTFLMLLFFGELPFPKR